ncbi:hypothetical protein TI04_05895 [Achromatium sp. WMS2]|nr:hypothetical protein TI04_05895 [Achromatium sp. WMS2]
MPSQTSTDSVCLPDILLSLSNAMDLMHPSFVKHHSYVAYITYRIADVLGYTQNSLKDLVLAALLHDIGAFSERERLELLSFDDNLPEVHNHSEIGYQLLKDFTPLATAAHYIRFHHYTWNSPIIKDGQNIVMPVESSIIHLADRVAVSITKDKNILRQASEIRKLVSANKLNFDPKVVNAFIYVSFNEEFWFNTLHEPISSVFCSGLGFESITFDSTEFDALVRLFRRIIDFRNAFTAIHSSGVGATASAIAKLAGFDSLSARVLKYAGQLHDLGKIAIPVEIIQKPTRLTPSEHSLLRIHPYHTSHILSPIKPLSQVRIWASQHHERIDGSGYPWHISGSSLSTGSRIIAIADIFTALTENRPYRHGSSLKQALKILNNMMQEASIDPDLCPILFDNMEEVDYARSQTQTAALREYQAFNDQLLANIVKS